MNYRHSFHAGNFADLVKHAVVLDLVERMQTADARPLTVIDTHAGGGLYDLSGDAARSREAEAGIARLMAADEALPAPLEALAARVRARNVSGEVRWYPGSPLLAAEMLRPSDRYLGHELRPEECERLAETLAPYPNAHALNADGYRAALAGIGETNGPVLILIDPPFERGDDYQRAAETAGSLVCARPDTVVAIWTPIKDMETFDGFLRRLDEAGGKGALVSEARLRPLTNPMKMNGCAMVMLSPPAGADTAARAVCDWVVASLGEPGGKAEVWRM